MQRLCDITRRLRVKSTRENLIAYLLVSYDYSIYMFWSFPLLLHSCLAIGISGCILVEKIWERTSISMMRKVFFHTMVMEDILLTVLILLGRTLPLLEDTPHLLKVIHLTGMHHHKATHQQAILLAHTPLLVTLVHLIQGMVVLGLCLLGVLLPLQLLMGLTTWGMVLITWGKVFITWGMVVLHTMGSSSMVGNSSMESMESMECLEGNSRSGSDFPPDSCDFLRISDCGFYQ